jgi:hypothetical protein
MTVHEHLDHGTFRWCIVIILWDVDLLLGNDREISDYTTAVAK